MLLRDNRKNLIIKNVCYETQKFRGGWKKLSRRSSKFFFNMFVPSRYNTLRIIKNSLVCPSLFSRALAFEDWAKSSPLLKYVLGYILQGSIQVLFFGAYFLWKKKLRNLQLESSFRSNSCKRKTHEVLNIVMLYI